MYSEMAVEMRSPMPGRSPRIGSSPTRQLTPGMRKRLSMTQLRYSTSRGVESTPSRLPTRCDERGGVQRCATIDVILPVWYSFCLLSILHGAARTSRPGGGRSPSPGGPYNWMDVYLAGWRPRVVTRIALRISQLVVAMAILAL